MSCTPHRHRRHRRLMHVSQSDSCAPYIRTTPWAIGDKPDRYIKQKNECTPCREAPPPPPPMTSTSTCEGRIVVGTVQDAAPTVMMRVDCRLTGTTGSSAMLNVRAAHTKPLVTDTVKVYTAAAESTQLVTEVAWPGSGTVGTPTNDPVARSVTPGTSVPPVTAYVSGSPPESTATSAGSVAAEARAVVSEPMEPAGVVQDGVEPTRSHQRTMTMPAAPAPEAPLLVPWKPPPPPASGRQCHATQTSGHVRGHTKNSESQ
jgi:hypothetical protein